jgi:hypothetical protein
MIYAQRYNAETPKAMEMKQAVEKGRENIELEIEKESRNLELEVRRHNSR